MPQTKKVAEPGGAVEASEPAPVLVAYDGSAGGQDALELARVLCSAEGARCIIGSREKLDGFEIETHVVGTRAPARMLAEFAEREGVGTIVVGSPHRGKIGRALLGSVAEHLLHHSPCALIIAPRGYRSEAHTGLRKIAVAYDGTDVAKDALRRAEEIAARSGCSIEIIVAEDIVVSGGPGGVGIRERRSAAEVMQNALESIDPAIKTEGKAIDPGWRQVVSEVAEALTAACGDDVDLLLLGSKTGSERLLYGSVSKRLIAAAPCPVLVIPHT